MINLWNTTMPYASEDVDFIPHLKEYIAGSKGIVVVCPGGGYSCRADHEGDAIGEWFNSIGISAVVLEYRVAPYKHPAEMSDVQRAIRYVRHNAEKYGIDKDKIAVMGFSAGGHLAASASVHYDKKVYEPTDEIDKESAKPDASILCYSVIDMGDYRHDGSMHNLLGGRPTDDMRDFMSCHKQITTDTPEAFLWHTSSDECVPVMNSLLYAQGLATHSINYEMHIYPEGGHGLGLAPNNEYVSRWSEDLERWQTYKGWK